MTHINLNGLSYDTLVSMVEDLNDQIKDLSGQLGDLQNVVEQNNKCADSNYQEMVVAREEARLLRDKLYQQSQDCNVQIRQTVAENMLEHVGKLASIDAAQVVCGLVSNVCDQKIRAIKALRQRTGLGLKETKEAVENWKSRCYYR